MVITRVRLIALVLVIVSIIVTLNLFFYQSYQSEMADQISKQQLIIAKTVASSISDSIDHYKEEIADFSGLLALRGLDREGLDKFLHHAFTELREEVSTNLTILDEAGNLVLTTWEGQEMEYRQCQVGEIPELGADEVSFDDSTIEKGLLCMAAPIRKNGKFIGSLLVGISIDDINNKFLRPIKSGKSGYAWMMNGSGTLMYHPTESGMIGKNIYHHDEHCYECHKSFNVEKEILASSDVGFSSYVAPYGEDKLVSFSWIKTLKWIVCVSIPYSEVTASIKNSMSLHSLLVISISILTVIGASIIIFINRERINAEAKARYADKVREYADELENIVQERTKELMSEKGKLDAVVSSLEAGICIFEKDSGCKWKNTVMSKWLSEEKAGDFSLGMIYGDQDVVEAVSNTVVKKNLVQDVVHLDLGMKRGYFQISLSPFNAPDGSRQLLMLLLDVTDLKMAEERLMQSEKLIALARLSAGVAHEIGNPLTSISSYVQILRGMEFDNFTTESLDTIFRHIKRIDSILKNMSDFSRTKSGEVDYYDPAEIVQSTVELVRYDDRIKKMKIDVLVPGELSRVNVDRNQLVQVFVNLILNAADSMGEGGILYVRGARVNGQVEVSFEDTGPGIKKEDLDRIFEPFYTTKESGTGLGLTVSYGIVRSFGGNILVESEPEKGTIFRVRLPAHE
jgi:signal transduction histidine kinase